MTAIAASVRGEQRFTNGRRCPICGGADRDPRGKGRRCHGYISTDGDFAHCSREEHAGGLELVESSLTYGHRLRGACGCGTTHGEDDSAWRGIELAYDYRDASGVLLFQVVRRDGTKDFIQRRPDGAGGWIWKTAGLRRVLYRLPELNAAPLDRFVFISEGEKDVESLRHRGLVATTNPEGAKKWARVLDCASVALLGRDVVILPDADDVGREHAQQIATSLANIAATVRVLDLFPEERESGRDVSDWFAAGHDAEELQQIAEHAEILSTGPQPVPPDPFQAELAQALEDIEAKLGEKNTAARVPLFGLDATDLLGKTFAPTPWQISGLVTRGGTAVAAGEPKAGIKTWLLVEAAMAIATGTRMCGEFVVDAGRVAYFFAEDQEQAVHNRVRALLAGANRTIEPGRLRLEPRGAFLDVLKNEDLAWIVASCRRLGAIDLLVLDPLRDIHSGEEDKSDDMRDVMRRLRVLGDLLSCTVLVSHHVAKSTKDTSKRRVGQGMRGSSAIHGSIDSGIYIEPLEGDGTNVFRARMTSQVKSGRSAGAFDIELAITDNDQGEAVHAGWKLARQSKAPKVTQKQLEQQERTAKASADDATVLRWVIDLARQGVRCSRTALRERDDRPIAERRVTAALDRMIEAGKLAICDGVVSLAESPSNRGES